MKDGGNGSWLAGVYPEGQGLQDPPQALGVAGLPGCHSEGHQGDSTPPGANRTGLR